ncbi:MAG: DUF3127 domain-containing protein [Gemmatimonadales bacterium]|nr:MAG: DUF3127 domain-containing protein [Gemmatimonadales bacterium]
MDLQITGKVTQILPEQSGESRNGPWRKQEFIIETEGKYPKQICVVQWGDNIDQFGITEGETISAHIDLQSREHNGRWYTDVKAWRVERPQGQDQGQQAGGSAPPSSSAEPWPSEAPMDDGSADDLPF